MTETPTPRTDAVKYDPSGCVFMVGDEWVVDERHCRRLETDLHHLARVAREALKLCIEALEPSDTLRHICPEFPGLDAARAALSEINQIKNK